MMRDVPIEVLDLESRTLLKNIREFTDSAAEEGNIIMDEIQTRDMKQLREAVFLVEDAIDEYMILEERQPPDPGCAALSCEIVDLVKTMILRHQIKFKFNALSSQFAVIIKEMHSPLEQGQRSTRGNKDATTLTTIFQQAPLYMHEADIVGFEAPSAKLLDWLLQEKVELTVFCVVGMTGLGKTTLAKKVFDSMPVITHFYFHVWITVSQSYSVNELLRELLYSIYTQNKNYLPQGISEMNTISLCNEVRKYLYPNRYVVFFDDVCNLDFWDAIKFALPDSNNGSKILITTKKMNVALYCKQYYSVEIYEMQPLNLAKSLELFNRKAFFDIRGSCPENLHNLCLEIVKKCKGLPLAIVAISGALSVKDRNQFEWHMFSKHLHSYLINSSVLSDIKQILSSDYDNLPFFLKPCLLYFAIYPEDYEIKSKRLIRHWIAEGFITNMREPWTFEKDAEEHLQELIQRCLVQKSFVRVDGKVKGVRIYDLLLVLLRQKARDYGFCELLIDHDRPLDGIIRRLSIATPSNDLLGSIESSHVRSLLFFTEDELPESFVKGIPTKYKLLKVLDFENARLLDVPENVGDLIHLKYLSFRNTDIRSIPKSIGKLQNLETLDLRQTDVNELPKEISKLKKLRHLLGNKMSLIHLKGGVGGMESLQTLSEVRIDEDGIELITELGKLGQLRKLSLFDVLEEHEIALRSSIYKMEYLEKLNIEAKSEDAAIDLRSFPFPASLQKLHLKAKLKEFPVSIPNLMNLVELRMSHSQLTEVPLESLQNLPCLSVLNLLVRSYEGESLHFQDGGFRKLKELGLRYLSNLKSIVIEEGALHSLKELTFMNIPNLKKAPSGIDHLKNLEVLNTHFMPTEFMKSIALLAKLIKEKNERRY